MPHIATRAGGVCYHGRMQLVHCMPIIRGGSRAGELTYFSTETIPVGSLVSVPLRSKRVSALVVGAEEVESAKLALKRSSFSIRKLGKQEPVELLSEEFVEAAKRVAGFHASNMGAVLFALLPHAIRMRRKHPHNLPAEKISLPTKNPQLVFQAPRQERLATYRSIT